MTSATSAAGVLMECVDRLVEDHLGALAPAALVSVWAGLPGAAPVLTRAPAAPHYAASTMKLPLVMAAYRLHERGDLLLDAPVEVHNRFRSRGDGTTFALLQRDDQDDATWARVGGRATVRDLARQAVVRSGNLAANLLLNRVGPKQVEAVLRDVGCSERTTLPRGIGDVAAQRRGLENRVTAPDLALLMGALATRRVVGPTAAAELERLLSAQEHREQVPAGLPPGTYVADKPGWVDGVALDVALVRPTGRAPYVLAVCSTAPADERTLSGLSAAISAAVWKHWTR